MCYVKFKETNQICSLLKISQSINAESSCDSNNKSMYSCFYESNNSREWKCFFLSYCKKFFVNTEILFMADLLPNGLHERVMICSICYITKCRLDVQFNRWKKRSMIKINNGFYIKYSIHLLLNRIVINVLWTSSIK